MKPIVLIVLAAGAAAHADVAYDNFGPGTTFTGSGWLVRGPQVSPWWTHAFPITPTVSGEVTTVTVAICHIQNATNNYTFELRADAGGTPGAVIGTLGQVAGITPGATIPAQFTASPGTNITAGTNYWVYARGEGDANGTWLTTATPGGTRAYSFNGGSSWTIAALSPPSGQGAIRIEVTPSAGGCYANCDGSTTQPVLTANDFQCFINKYAAGDSAANCDGSTAQPLLTANDFQCFINKYAGGCR